MKQFLKMILMSFFIMQLTNTLMAESKTPLASTKKVTVEQLFSVQKVKVKKETISQKVKNHGYVVKDESRIYDVSPRFGGYVVDLYADTKYKKVRKGEALVKVYSPEVFKAKDEYLNTYKYTKKRPNKGMLNSAKLKLELLGISQKEIDKVITDDMTIENTTIYAPIDGFVFMKNLQKGTAFKAKQKLFEIVNLDEVWVEAKLFEKDRKGLSSIQSYELSFKGISKVYKTKESLLYPQLDPKLATLSLRLQVKNEGHHLFPGMYANVLSIKGESEQLTLPTTAVIRKDAKHYVFVVGEYEGEYEPLEVTVKEMGTKKYIILEGLQEGDEVVNNALFMMDSDAQINGLY